MNRLILLDRLLSRSAKKITNPMRIQQAVFIHAAAACCFAHGFSPVVVPGRSLIATSSSSSITSRHFASRKNTLRYMSENENGADIDFKHGDAIQIEVISFGPMGGSVDVVGLGHDPDKLIPETAPSLGQGLVLQKEIHYFRQARDNIDVVAGEVLPAFVEEVRDDGRLNISLRRPGGKAKAEDVSILILERLSELDGTLAIGDKSSPREIGLEFPGVSKGAFKKAVAALYKLGKVQPGPDSISLMTK